MRPQSAPRIVAIEPRTVTRGVASTLVVSGTGFLPELTAFVGTAARETPEFPATEVRPVEFVASTRAVLHLPSNLPAGRLDVTLINPDDGLARLTRGLTVVVPVVKAPQGEVHLEAPNR